VNDCIFPNKLEHLFFYPQFYLFDVGCGGELVGWLLSSYITPVAAKLSSSAISCDMEAE